MRESSGPPGVSDGPKIPRMISVDPILVSCLLLLVVGELLMLTMVLVSAIGCYSIHISKMGKFLVCVCVNLAWNKNNDDRHQLFCESEHDDVKMEVSRRFLGERKCVTRIHLQLAQRSDAWYLFLEIMILDIS